MVVLTAYAHFVPDKIDQALDACRTVRSKSVEEPGCERYDFYVSPDKPGLVVFVEEWTSKADLDLHFQQDAFKEFGAAIQSLLVSPPDIRIFDSTRLS